MPVELDPLIRVANPCVFDEGAEHHKETYEQINVDRLHV